MLSNCFVAVLLFFVLVLDRVNGRPACLGYNSTQYYPELLDVTLNELTIGLNGRSFSSVDLVNAYIDRILEVNSTLHAVTEINPDAIDIAAELDAERAAGITRGPLHGIPIIIKGNIATNDKLSTSAGSFALLGAKVASDSTIASKLRAAGAIILGKSNLSQWANFRSNNSTNGWSAYGDQTFGAYYPEQDPSGSSSGSGVVSSLGLAFASLGTETSGSILSPAEVNNVVGIKPTVGLTSRSLVVPISEHQDTIGPMARTVIDAAYVLQAIAGKDSQDNYTSAQPFDTPPDYVAACKQSALEGARIGVPRNLIDETQLPDSTSLDSFNAAIEVLKAAGAIIIDNTNITAFALDQLTNGDSVITVLGADFVADLPKEYLSKLTTNPQNVHTLEDVRNFTQNLPIEDYPDRDTGVWDDALDLGFDNTSPEFWAAYQLNLQIAGPEGITGLLRNYSLDALILPTNFSYALPALIGSPAVTVPLGAFDSSEPVVRNDRGTLVETGPNIPFGISFLGAKWSEASLIGYAFAYEQRTKIREQIKPYILPRTEIVHVVQNNCSWTPPTVYKRRVSGSVK